MQVKEESKMNIIRKKAKSIKTEIYLFSEKEFNIRIDSFSQYQRTILIFLAIYLAKNGQQRKVPIYFRTVPKIK